MHNVKGIKWDRAVPICPLDNMISTDFPKFVPPHWKFLDDEPVMSLVLANEYQRMWAAERDALHKKMYYEKTAVNVNVVQRYVQRFKKTKTAPKPEPKKPFKMKKFQNIPSIIKNVRVPGDKAMAYLKGRDRKKKKKK